MPPRRQPGHSPPDLATQQPKPETSTSHRLELSPRHHGRPESLKPEASTDALPHRICSWTGVPEHRRRAPAPKHPTPRSSTAESEHIPRRRREEQGTKIPGAGRHLRSTSQPGTKQTQRIERSVSTKPPQLADAAEHVAGREIELGHLYSLVAPLSPSRRRHQGPLHYYKHARDTGTRFHPSPAAETANGEEQNHRPGRQRSEEPKSPPFSPLEYCPRLERERELRRSLCPNN